MQYIQVILQVNLNHGSYVFSEEEMKANLVGVDQIVSCLGGRG